MKPNPNSDDSPRLDSRLSPRASNGPPLASRLSPLDTPVSAVVAEDDEGLNRLICKRLERQGIKLVGVHSGADAIAAIKQNPDCLLLLDYVLIDMDGHQLLDKLSNMGLRVPFIVMTGRGDESVAVEMMKLGARDYLVKQPDFLELVPPVVERVLGQIATERKLDRAEMTLRESEARFRALFENSGSCVAVYEATDDGADFIIRDFNRAAERTASNKGPPRERSVGSGVPANPYSIPCRHTRMTASPAGARTTCTSCRQARSWQYIRTSPNANRLNWLCEPSRNARRNTSTSPA